MLNSPYRKPYEKELNNNDSGRRKVVYIIIAVAVIAATIPLVMLLLKGWLSPANEDDGEVLVVSNETVESSPANPVITPAELPVTAQVSATDGFAPGASINPPDNAVPAIEVPNTPAPVPAVAVPTVTAVPTVETPTPAVNTPAEITAVPTNNAPAAAAVTAVAPPPPGVSVTKVSDAPPETPSVTATKPAADKAVTAKPAKKKARTFRPLTAAELAALKKANSSGKTNVSAADKRKYNEKLFTFVRSNWSAPSPASVNNRKLKAAITLTVAPDGTISNVKFVTPSYVNAMDDSVRTLIRNIQKHKAPAPGFNTGAIKIELRN